MEIDDDFGDLYSDLMLPVPYSSKPPSPPSNPNPSLDQIYASPRAAAAAADVTSTIVNTFVAASPTVDDDELEDQETDTNPTKKLIQIDTNPSKDEKPRDSVSSPDKMVSDMDQTAVNADVADQEELQTVIPGLGTAVGPTESDDWDDSDSEDDLKIVLNDTEHGTMDDLGYRDGDEEEDLVIVTNDDQIGAIGQDWGEEGAGPGGEGDGKEGDASKVAGLGGAGGAGPSRIGNSHAFHQHHSMYKVEMHACYGADVIM